MTFLRRAWTAGHPAVTSIKVHCQVSTSLSLPVLILVTTHILLTPHSVGLSLYLQSRFLYTFDNQIIYVIKNTHKNIYIYL